MCIPSKAQYIIFVTEYDLFFSNMYELFNSIILKKKGGATVVWKISAQIYAHKKLIFIDNCYVYSVPRMLLVLGGMLI